MPQEVGDREVRRTSNRGNNLAREQCRDWHTMGEGQPREMAGERFLEGRAKGGRLQRNQPERGRGNNRGY
jgi:hypothetical protein